MWREQFFLAIRGRGAALYLRRHADSDLRAATIPPPAGGWPIPGTAYRVLVECKLRRHNLCSVQKINDLPI